MTGVQTCALPILRAGGAAATTANGASLNFAAALSGVSSTLNIDQSVPGTTNAFRNLTINRTSGNVTLSGDIILANALTMTAGTLTLGSNTLTLNSVVNGSSTITGSATSNIIVGSSGALGSLSFTTGARTLNNFTVLNAGASASLGSALSVTGTLTLGGIVTTGINTLTAVAGSVTATTGWVNGKLQLSVTPSTVAFPIGDATNYTPVTLVISSGTGTFTANTTVPGVPPAAGNTPAGSGISQTKYINRNWTLSTTIGSPSYSAQFTYIDPADVVGSANTSALIVGQNNGGTWSNPGVATSVSPSVTTVTGLTTTGIFSLGETNCIVPTALTYTSNTVTYCKDVLITTPNTASYTGTTPGTYTGTLPTGLTLNSSKIGRAHV